MAELQPYAELRAYKPTPSERVGNVLQDFLMNMGANSYNAGRMAHGIRDIASASPLGILMSGADAVDANARGDGLGTAAAMAGILPAVGPEIRAATKGIRAYHGSPHDFDRFDLSKIGTGEGAQAYGHGLYFAEAEDVAKGYRDRIAGADWVDRRGVPIQSNTIAYDVMDQARKDGLGILDAQDAANMWSVVARDGEGASNFPGYESVKKVLDKHGIRLREKGSMYEVRINANPDDFLDWDKPLSQMPPEVQKKLADAWLAHPDVHAGQYGSDIYRAAQDQAAFNSGRVGSGSSPAAFKPFAAQATDTLRQAGIPGIKYLDQGSRGAGEGSRNYVVFDDSLIDILRKYGWLPPVAGGVAAMSQSQAEAAQ